MIDKQKKIIYFDHAATTPLSKKAFESMIPFFMDDFGNASSLHVLGRKSAFAVTEARAKIASLIGAKTNEIYFCSGGTESCNWAIKGFLDKGTHIITSSIEHPSIMAPLKELEQKGIKVTYLPVYKNGIVKPSDLEKAITKDTALISIMFANNEIGTIQPIKELTAIANKHKIPFHTDAVQAIGSMAINVKDLNVDMLSLSAHKFYGPKGIGALYIKGGIRPNKLIHGGSQERTMRGGTSNVAAIVGCCVALEEALNNLDDNSKHIRVLRNTFIDRVLCEIEHCYLNGDRDRRLDNNANFVFDFVEGESILMMLDLNGIAVSSGSACSSGSLSPSHVLLSLGVPIESAHGSIRFSFGIGNTMDHINYAVDKLKETINKLREMSPLFLQVKGDSKFV
ncbi:MAG: cysteine desulfurase [Firmicutes bacterium]|nr:cysteine desulfurase [Bacillota bacterium]